MIFRELHNQESSKEIKLKFLKNRNLVIYDLEDPDSNSERKIGGDGTIDLSISQRADYLFLRYEIADNKILLDEME